MNRKLNFVGAGESAFIVGIEGGDKARSRLESMGLIPGIEVEVLNNANGPLIVSVGEGRIMVERGVAAKVLVA